MSEQGKKRQRIYDLLNVETKLLFLPTVYKVKKKNPQKKSFLRKRWRGGLNEKKKQKKRKEGFLTSLSMGIKKDPTTSRRKHANELNVDEKMWGHQLN